MVGFFFMDGNCGSASSVFFVSGKLTSPRRGFCSTDPTDRFRFYFRRGLHLNDAFDLHGWACLRKPKNGFNFYIQY
jgi:hypothetical protein